MKTARNKRKNKITTSFPKPMRWLLVLLLLVTAGGIFLFINRENINWKNADNLSLKIEQPQLTDTTETSESITSNQPVASIPTQIQPQQTQSQQGKPQDQTNGIETVLSKVIRTGIVSTEGKQIALTFDIGWLYENTESLLNILDQYNVKATFFARGNWVKDHPGLAVEIVNRGYSLESHSLTHGHMTTMTDTQVENEIRGTKDIIKETTGYQVQLFRPPYGEYDNRMLKILQQEGYPYTILWTLDSYDWAEEMNGVKITKDYLVNRILNNASDNGIVLMHIGGYETVNALPEIINGLRSQGYEMVKVSDML